MAQTTEKNTLPEAGASGKKRRQTVEFEKHIYEVAKEENPELEITVEAIDMMNNMLHMIVNEAAKNAATFKQTSLNINDFKAAVKQLFSGGFARYANLHGYLTCTTFETSLAHEQDIKDRESQQLADYLDHVEI